MWARRLILLVVGLTLAGPAGAAPRKHHDWNRLIETRPASAVAREALSRFADTVVEASGPFGIMNGPGASLMLLDRPRGVHGLQGLCQVTWIDEHFFTDGKPAQLRASSRYKLLMTPDWGGVEALVDNADEAQDVQTTKACGELDTGLDFFEADDEGDAWTGTRLLALGLSRVTSGSLGGLTVLCREGAACEGSQPFGDPKPSDIRQITRLDCPPSALFTACFRIELSPYNAVGEEWTFEVQGGDQPTRLQMVEHGYSIE